MKPEDLIKTKPAKRLHINVRLTGDEAAIWQELTARTPELTDSQRVRDAIRIALHALLTKNPAIIELKVFRPGDEGNTGRRAYHWRKAGRSHGGPE